MIYEFKKPPTTVLINETEYQINWDFEIWALNFEKMILDFSETDDEHNLKVAFEMEMLFLGKIVNEPLNLVLKALIDFYAGYPKEPNGSSSESSNEKAYSFYHDYNLIVLAIRNQTGIDLTYKRTEKFHWWDFLLEFETLEDHHIISKKIGYRLYQGDDKELLKLKKYHALPLSLSRKDKELSEKMDKLFYNT